MIEMEHFNSILNLLRVEPEQAYFEALPAERYQALPKHVLTHLCYSAARYAVPTAETLDFIFRQMQDFRPEERMEVGSGMGDFAFHLSIHGTDSACQDSPEMRNHYLSLGQAPCIPPSTIERISALEAVRKYRPRVVLACWVTQLFQAEKGDEVGKAQSFLHGVDEEALLDSGVEKYIFVGNLHSHGKKRILSRPHKEFAPPWLVSRAQDQSANRIWIWEK